MHRADGTRPLFTEARRKRLYEIALAVLGLLVVYGFVNAEQATAWQSLATMLLLGMARANVNQNQPQR